MEPMDEIAAGFHDAMGSRRKILLIANLRRHRARNNDNHEPLKIASGCSGTDLFKFGLDAANNYWKGNFNMEIAVDHVFSVDHDPGKQKWLLDHFSLSYLFKEMKEVAKGWAYDLRSKRYVHVPRSNLWIFGFECDSISSYNVNASENRCCAQDFSDKTGSSLGYALAYEEWGGPEWIIIEIVRNVFTKPKDGSSSVYEVILALMNRRGIFISPETLWAQKYGPANSRGRVWILCQKIATSAIDQTAKSFTPPGWAADASAMLKDLERPALPLERFLVGPEDEERILNSGDPRFQPNKVVVPQGPANKKVKGEDYKAKHLEVFAAAEITWPPDWSSRPILRHRVRHLTERQKEIVFFYTVVHERSAASAGVETSHDINLNITWGSDTADIVCCVATTSIIWLRLRERLLFGQEALALQGVGFEQQSRGSEQYTQHESFRLAGDAFNGFVAMAVLVTLFTVEGMVPKAFDQLEQPAVVLGKSSEVVGKSAEVVGKSAEVVPKSSGVAQASSRSQQEMTASDDAADSSSSACLDTEDASSDSSCN